MKTRMLLIISLFLITLLSCGPLTTPTSIPSTNPTATREAEPPAPTATSDPGLIPSPTSRPGPRDLDSSGPWLLVVNDGSVSAFNADGTGYARLLEKEILSFALSPAGDALAYITDANPQDEADGLQLWLFELPYGPDELVTDLQNPALLDPGAPDPGREVMQAIRMDAPRWSNSGDYIAFIGQAFGPSADLYVYDVGAREITQLTDGPSHAYGISWSPLDEYIFQAAAWTFGTGAGFDDAGSWVARSDDTGIVEISTGNGSDDAVAWNAPRSVILASWRQPCGFADLQSFDIDARTFTEIWPYFLEDFAFSEQTGQLALLIQSSMSSCTQGGQETGLFFLNSIGGTPQMVSSQDFNGVLVDPSGMGAFLVYNDDELYRLDAPNHLEFLGDAPSRDPQYAPRSQTWLWFGNWQDTAGLWVGQLPGTPMKIFHAAVMDATWSPDGSTIYFVGTSDHLLYKAQAPGFVPEQLTPSIIYDGVTNLLWGGR
jgi:dipeptidyl aminopeptidase/acylaminoacyl peptidase